jgi:hypothetical protein
LAGLFLDRFLKLPLSFGVDVHGFLASQFPIDELANPSGSAARSTGSLLMFWAARPSACSVDLL